MDYNLEIFDLSSLECVYGFLRYEGEFFYSRFEEDRLHAMGLDLVNDF